MTASTGEHGTVSQAGTSVTVTPAFYINSLAPGRSTYPYSPTVRFSTATTPTNCRVDDANCDGSAETPPAAPANLRATVKTTRTITLAWNASQAGSLPVTGYEVYRGGTLVASPTDTTATLTGLTPNTEYTFTVLAKDRKGTKSAASAPLAVRTNNPSDDTQAPTVPGNLRSTGADAGSISLAWNASTDNTGVVAYDVYRGSTLALTVTGTTAKVSGLAPSTQYSFTVRARDGYDNTSGASNAVTASTQDIVGGYAKVAYFVQWGIYGRQYFVRNLETSGAANKLTHLLYAFQNIDPVNLTCLSGVTKGTTREPAGPEPGRRRR